MSITTATPPALVLLCLDTACYGHFYMPLDLGEPMVCPNDSHHAVMVYSEPLLCPGIVEPRECEYCSDEHDHCDSCGEPTILETCPACGSLTCEIQAMEVGDARERRGLPR